MKIALAILALIFFAVFFLKLRIMFEYVKNEGESGRLELYLVFLGKIRINILNGEKKNKKSKKDSAPDKDEKPFFQRIDDAKKTVSALAKAYGKTRGFLRKRLIFEKTEVYVKFGTGDAASTGIATGALWALLYQVLAFIGCVGTVDKHNFDVVPVYNACGFCMRITGIISLRLINIIIGAVKYFIAYKKIVKE